MTPDSRAGQFAQALINVAEKLNSIKPVQESLELVCTVSKKIPSFRALIQSRRIPSGQKSDILKNVLQDKCHPLVIEFAGTLDSENNVQLLQEGRDEFRILAKAALDILPVRAEVAETLDESAREILHTNLESSLGKKTELAVDVDPALLGGIKLRIENFFLDASLQSQLERMRESFKQA